SPLLIFPPVHGLPALRRNISRKSLSNQTVVVVALGYKIEEVTRSLDHPLRVWRTRGDVYTDRTVNHNFLIADHKFNFEAGEPRPGADGDVLRIAVVRVFVHVISLCRLHVGDAPDDSV